jgi:hypothetical protein
MRAQFTVTPAEAGFASPKNSTSDGYFRWLFTGKPEVN